MSFGYINLISTSEELVQKKFFIEVEKKKYEAILEPEALHDPKNKMVKN